VSTSSYPEVPAHSQVKGGFCGNPLRPDVKLACEVKPRLHPDVYGVRGKHALKRCQGLPSRANFSSDRRLIRIVRHPSHLLRCAFCLVLIELLNAYRFRKMPPDILMRCGGLQG
jgi:hypothetical protein